MMKKIVKVLLSLSIVFCLACMIPFNTQATDETGAGKSGSTSESTDLLYNIENAEITLSYTSCTYSASAKKPSVTVVMNGTELEKGTDYTVSYSKNKNVGTALVTITGTGSYTGEATCSFKINARSVTSDTVEISSISKKTYTGEQIKPTVTLTYKDKELEKGTDYTVSYGDNKNTGKGTVTINGTGNFKGSKKITFKIVPKKVTISETRSKKKAIYADWKKPTGTTKFQVAYRKKGSDTWKYKTTKNTYITISSLAVGTNYQFKVRAYKLVDDESKYYGNWSSIKTIKTRTKNSTAVSCYDCEIDRKHDYCLAEIEDTWEKLSDEELSDYFLNTSPEDFKEFYKNLTKAERKRLLKRDTFILNTTSVEDGHGYRSELPYYLHALEPLTISKTDFVYNGETQRPKITVWSDIDVKMDEALYTVSKPKNSKNAEHYIITVTFKEDAPIKGTMSICYKINPKGTSIKTVTAGDQSFKVTWKKQTTQTTGYVIQYSKRKDFSSSDRVYITDNEKTSKTIKNLKKNTTYYVRICTYKLAKGENKESGINPNSSWSEAKKVTIK